MKQNMEATKEQGDEIGAITSIFKQPGEVRGVVLCTDARYVIKHYGKQALRDVESYTSELGYPILYDNIKATALYPVILRGISLIAVYKILGFKEDDLRKMGWSAPRNSVITKLMMKYFASLDMIVEELQTYWRRNYSVGTLTGRLSKQSVQLLLEGLNIPKKLLPYLEGYFTSVLSMVIGNNSNVRMANIEIVNQNSPCYRFTIDWQGSSMS